MLENLGRSRGVVFSGTLLLELARRGISREQAYEWVQRNAMRAFHEQRDFKALFLADADVMKVLTPAEVEKAFDLDDQLRNVDAVIDRVFARPLCCRRQPERRAMKARVFVTLKKSVFDPQGKTIADALHSLGLHTASPTSARASSSSST